MYNFYILVLTVSSIIYNSEHIRSYDRCQCRCL